jgi:hypothetical protein
MEFNQSIIDAARKTIEERDDLAEPIEIKGFRKMFVAKSENSRIQPLSFFSHADERFMIGPLRNQ